MMGVRQKNKDEEEKGIFIFKTFDIKLNLKLWETNCLINCSIAQLIKLFSVLFLTFSFFRSTQHL